MGLDVKLIDLDRSVKVTKLFRSTPYSSFRSSVMYRAVHDWTVGQVDRRQLEIMVYALFNNITGVSYHSKKLQANSSFLWSMENIGQTCGQCGTRNRTLKKSELSLCIVCWNATSVYFLFEGYINSLDA